MGLSSTSSALMAPSEAATPFIAAFIAVGEHETSFWKRASIAAIDLWRQPVYWRPAQRPRGRAAAEILCV